jgi:hypothetical protein
MERRQVAIEQGGWNTVRQVLAYHENEEAPLALDKIGIQK